MNISSTQRTSPLRQRMIEGTQMRKLSSKTQGSYIRAARHFAGFIGDSPDTAGPEDQRRYHLHGVDRCGRCDRPNKRRYRMVSLPESRFIRLPLR